ncbi:MAG: cohesin domain-containing protein [Dehalococcoidia bacterium]
MRLRLCLAVLSALTVAPAALGSGSGRASAGAAGSVNFSLDSASYSANVGDTFHVKVRLGDLTNNLTLFDFLLPYDYSGLQVVATDPTSPNPCPWGLQDLMYYPDYSGLGLRFECGNESGPPASPAQSGTVQLIDITFECIGAYSGNLQIDTTWGIHYAYNASGQTYNAGAGSAATVVCNALPTATPTDTPTPTSTSTPTATRTPTYTPTATSTPTASPTSTPADTSTPTATATDTPVASSTPSPTATTVARHHHASTDTPVPPAATAAPTTRPPQAPVERPPAGLVGGVSAPNTGGGPPPGGMPYFLFAGLLATGLIGSTLIRLVLAGATSRGDSPDEDV